MDVHVYDTNFKMVDIVDAYESLLWVIRYNKTGECEIYTAADSGLMSVIKRDYYLMLPTSNRAMIVDSISTPRDDDGHKSLIIKGNSLESILKRRIVWTQTTISGNLQNAIKKLITDAIINPSIADRKIPNFKFIDSDDPAITSLKIDEAQYTGDNLYEVIIKLCEDAKIGFEIVFDDNFNFCFSLYAGIDRSFDQDKNPYVVFSPKNDNLLSSDYTEDQTNYCNVTLVAGEGEGTARKTATTGSGSGLSRRELFTDARDVSTNNGEISEADYQKQLIQRGTEKLGEHKVKIDLEAEAEMTSLYRLGLDFFIGDLVQVVDDYGVEAKSRVKEIVTSISTSEASTYPTFEIEEDKK